MPRVETKFLDRKIEKPIIEYVEKVVEVGLRNFTHQEAMPMAIARAPEWINSKGKHLI